MLKIMLLRPLFVSLYSEKNKDFVQRKRMRLNGYDFFGKTRSKCGKISLVFH